MSGRRATAGLLRTAALGPVAQSPRRSASKPKLPARLPEPLEHESQVAFFTWWTMAHAGLRVPVNLCFAVPNGGHRHPVVAAKLKAEGVRRGTLDVFLLVPAGGFHGLLLEFKRKGNKPTTEQEAFIYETRRRGYNVLVVWGTDEAIHVVKAYLAGRSPEQL